MDESTPTPGPVSGTAGQDRPDRDDRADDRPSDAPRPEHDAPTPEHDAATQRDATPQGTVADVAPTVADPSSAGDGDTSDANVTTARDTGSGDVDDDTAVDPGLLARAEALADLPLAERADAFDRLNSDVQAALRGIEET